MATFRTRATTITAGAAVILLCGAAFAQMSPSGRKPTQADVEACKHEAQLSAGSALPGATQPRDGGAPTAAPPSAAGATGNTGILSGGSTLSGSATAAGQTDPGYQQVYRDCLNRLGYAD